MNIEEIRERMDSVHQMRAVSDANKERLFHVRGFSRACNSQDNRKIEVTSSKLFVRFCISLFILGIAYFVDMKDLQLFSVNSQKIKEVITYNIEFEDVKTFWYNDNVNKMVETLFNR